MSPYQWILALHVIATIAWMAGLFYLPRLFVYHAMSAPGSEQSETFKLMERRLLRVIMDPAMIASWLFGLWLLALNPALREQGYLQAKTALVVLMTVYHFYLARAVRLFAAGKNTRSHVYWRVMNEVPTLLMIAIIILVIVKPF